MSYDLHGLTSEENNWETKRGQNLPKKLYALTNDF